MAKCLRCNKFMLLRSQSGYCKDCYPVFLDEQEKIRQENARLKKLEEERKRKEQESLIAKSELSKIKQAFAVFYKEFIEEADLDENAWQNIDTSHLHWAQDAIDLKRKGMYYESCKLYFDHILKNKLFTSNWASGLFKSLACAGDIMDASRFANTVFQNYQRPEMLQMIEHCNELSKMALRSDWLGMINKLRALSGNPNYQLKVEQLDVYELSKQNQ